MDRVYYNTKTEKEYKVVEKRTGFKLQPVKGYNDFVLVDDLSRLGDEWEQTE